MPIHFLKVFFVVLFGFFWEGIVSDQSSKGDYGGVDPGTLGCGFPNLGGWSSDGPGYMRALLATLGVPIPGFLQGFEAAMFEVPKS